MATATYSGVETLIWGGSDSAGKPLGTGAAYDRAEDKWTELATNGAPSERYGHVAAWDGARMIIWGGQGAGINAWRSDGFAYTPGR